MFYTLRRILIVGLVAGLVGLGFYLYQIGERFRPALELLGLIVDSDWEHNQKPLGNIEGEVVAVGDGTCFLLKGPARSMYYFGLSGIEFPRSRPKDARTKRLMGESRTNLTKLILTRKVRINITYTNVSGAGLGIVFLDGTNVNAKVVEAGMAKVNRRFLKTLPVTDQYTLLCAEKKAREDRAGLWGSEGTLAEE